MFAKQFSKLDEEESERKNTFAVDSRDVELHYLYDAVMTDPSPETHQALKDELDHRMRIESIFNEAFEGHMKSVKEGTYPPATTEEEFECYGNLIDAFEEKCGASDYALKFYGAFLAECDTIKTAPAALDSTKHRLDKVCNKKEETA